jgi:hypothetical protein
LSASAPFAGVLRLASFKLSQAELELRLDAAVERYSLEKGGYAQISIEEEALDWEAIDAFLQKHGSAVKRLNDDGHIQSISLDLAYKLDARFAMISRTVPARTAALAGTHGIDIQFSVYRTASD